MDHARAYEVNLAIEHLKYSGDNDLLLYDRNYTPYYHLATLCKQDKKFAIRCSSASFSQARDMLQGNGLDSQIATLEPHHGKLQEIRSRDLPEQITVWFVRVQLETGEFET